MGLFKAYNKMLLIISTMAILYSCIKRADPPVLMTAEISGITDTSAISGGFVTSDGGAPVTERGLCWNNSENPTVNDTRTIQAGETGSFTSNMTGLTPNTLYFVRAYATNRAGIAYGNQVSFTTNLVLTPSVTTNEVKSFTATGAVSGGYITGDGGGAIIAKGVCWAITENPKVSDSRTSDGTTMGSYNSYLTGLTSSTKYYVRAYASNRAGTSYGDQYTFTTSAVQNKPVIFNPDLSYEAVSDNGGNSYKTIRIGNQTWMAENLRTTKYNDGTVIVNIIDDESWYGSESGAYCWYNNDISDKEIYGALYNWFAVSTGKLCPSGWHIPGHAEWMNMINAAGEGSLAGGYLKEIGTSHWQSPNAGATNESGFTALPGGLRNVDGNFMNQGISGRWWKSSDSAGVVEVTFNSSAVNSNASCSWRRGITVRCVKD